MTLAVLMNQTAVITRRTESGSDTYNNPNITTTTETTTCYAEQSVATEQDGQLSDIRDETWNIWLPAGTDVEGIDKITVDGLALEVTGEPWTVHNPRTRATSHVRLTGRKVT